MTNNTRDLIATNLEEILEMINKDPDMLSCDYADLRQAIFNAIDLLWSEEEAEEIYDTVML